MAAVVSSALRVCSQPRDSPFPPREIIPLGRWPQSAEGSERSPGAAGSRLARASPLRALPPPGAPGAAAAVTRLRCRPGPRGGGAPPGKAEAGGGRSCAEAEEGSQPSEARPAPACKAGGCRNLESVREGRAAVAPPLRALFFSESTDPFPSKYLKPDLQSLICGGESSPSLVARVLSSAALSIFADPWTVRKDSCVRCVCAVTFLGTLPVAWGF